MTDGPLGKGRNMRKVFALIGALTLVALAFAPATADEIPNPTERYVPRLPGIEEKMSFLFGPYTIPPGNDLNRVTLDVPTKTGFYTSVAPRLVDPVTAAEPQGQVAHIHHAHWLRVSTDPQEHPYNIGVEEYTQGAHLSWVFGTGEERTQGSLNDRASYVPGQAYSYGIFIKGEQPQALIYMIHNKTAAPLNLYVALDVQFVHGSRDQIKAAADCGPLFEASPQMTCRAGRDYRPLTGVLWGTTFDVPRGVSNFTANEYQHPRDIDPENQALGLGKIFTAPWNAEVVASGSHTHPWGKNVVVANLGPKDSGCEADVDGDGYPGTTIFNSRKIEHVSAAFASEDYQMAATHAAFRAPIHAGDRISQFGVYRNDLSPSYEAMSFTGIYVDREATIPAATGCNAASYGSVRLDDPAADATENAVPNHAFAAQPEPLCGLAAPHDAPCNRPVPAREPGIATTQVHISGFLYAPGDQALSGALGAPPRVAKGQKLRFFNEDGAAVIRHSITSCPWPCNGPYVANYPQPDGLFDSGLLGNIDPIDGAGVGNPPAYWWDLDTTALNAGAYSYYCRIHPWMRGAFEVV